MIELLDIFGGKKEMFDIIVMYFAIINVPREYHQCILEQCWELLKENGLLCIVIGDKDVELELCEWMNEPMYWSHFSATETIDMIKQCNFDIVTHQRQIDEVHNCHHVFLLGRKFIV
eukprot:312080_1